MLFLITFLLGVANPAAPAWATSSVTFMQGTVVASDAAGRTFSFVDASGRNRSHAVTSAAAAQLGRLRAGDEVIVVLSGTEPVVQDVRLSQAAPGAPADPPPPEGPAGADQTEWTVVPAQQMRPAWPNPYSRYYRGRKPAPKPGQRR